MDQRLKQIDGLAREWGYLAGDVDTDGLLNMALHLRGEPLFVDFHEDGEILLGREKPTVPQRQ